ncbi:MAG: CDP-glycerol glycerophosphotransferase family protein [Candidatus Lokiarchaeota archaeon]|nr:CDP-glycerol glycerophosphotransferase family protein [Candidatus Lokiarchaeota archaeon]
MSLQLERFIFLRNSKIYLFIRDILIPFGFKLISRLFRDKIDDKLIIMGGYGGNTYLDNTKYLFDYFNQHTDYRLFWVAKSRKLVKELRLKGYNAIHALNFLTIKLLRRARYIFISHGVYDLLPIEFSPKTTIILTWHGTPIKNIIFDEDLEFLVYKKWGRYFKLHLRYNDYLDYILTPTRDDTEHEILSNAFRVPKEKILALGYPKNDILFTEDEKFVKKLKLKYGILDEIERIILYCPTFRKDRSLRFSISKKEFQDLENLLRETKSIFLLKGHIYTQNINFKDYENIMIAPKDSDIQELYLLTDILITDYSSTMLDFSLLNRPILLFPYDLEDYKKNRGMYYDLEDIAPGPLLYNFHDLISGIRNIDKINKEYKQRRNEIRDRFNKYVDGNTIERILDFLKIKYS